MPERYNTASTPEISPDTGEKVREIEEELLRELGKEGLLLTGEIIVVDSKALEWLAVRMGNNPPTSMILAVRELTSGILGAPHSSL